MFTKCKISALALISSLVFTSTVQAETVTLEKYVSRMLNQATEVAQQEIKNNLRSAVLTVANNISFNEEKNYVANVSITDLKAINEVVTKAHVE
jgi:hypothetical protein